MRIGLSAIKPVAPLLAAACIAAILSVLAFFHLSELEADQRRADFARLAHDQTDAIHAEITATLALLHSLRGLFTVSENVTRGEFRAFVHSLEPGSAVQALEWIPRVPHERRAEVERAARADGLLEFHITERRDQGVMAPAATRAAYYPVFFVEPVSGNEAAIGFDLGSNAVRLAALESAGASGELVASSRITLVQEKENQFGFLVFVPVYRGDSTEHLRENLIGFGLGVYRIGALIAAALPRSVRRRRFRCWRKNCPGCRAVGGARTGGSPRRAGGR